jgi:hypothetical protein
MANMKRIVLQQMKSKSISRYSQGFGFKVNSQPTYKMSMLDQAFMKAYSDVEYAQFQIQALRFAEHDPDGRYNRDKDVQNALDTIITSIYARKCRAYERLYMFGAVSPNPQVVKSARIIAYQSMLKDTKHYGEILGHFRSYSDKPKLTTELHHLARKQNLRLAQMSKDTLHQDIRTLRQKVKDLERENTKLTNDLKVIHTLKP